VASKVTLEPTLVGDAVVLAGFSAGPAVIVGAALPTVTEVVTVSAYALKEKNITEESTRKEVTAIKRVGILFKYLLFLGIRFSFY
jgi:hypothetical protein